MTEPRIVTPEDAQNWLEARSLARSIGIHLAPTKIADDLGYTVATEPERIAAAVEAERQRWLNMTQEQIDSARGLW